MRPPRIHHCASEPLWLVGRTEELALLDASLTNEDSLVAFIGPGGQGKTAIVQHWLRHEPAGLDGLFFWSFYRGKDADLCMREWLAYAEGLDRPPEVSAAWCADRLLAVLRRERWAVVLDGAEVVQHEEGPWAGRFTHPDLGRLLEELASEPAPGAVVLTTRFGLPTLEKRRHARIVRLGRLGVEASRELLRRLGIKGDDAAIDAVAASAGLHAKAVELLGTFLVRFRGGEPIPAGTAEDDEEAAVGRVLELFRAELPLPEQDAVSLTTAFRDPPTEPLLLDYLRSPAVARLLSDHWERDHPPFGDDLEQLLDGLVEMRLLERVGVGPVIDAHPLVRRGFERGSASARAGFLRGRPDRRRATSLEEARGTVELFHAACEAGLWEEADAALVSLENPKHRLLAPALERDLLCSFFPGSDWRKPPLWAGFGRWRSLGIALEMLGDYEGALEAYRPHDAALRGDSLLALGRPAEIVAVERVAAPWQGLWQAYRAHALVLMGRVAEGVALARAMVPTDPYEWTHIFEALLRAGATEHLDARSLGRADHAFGGLAMRRIRLDLARVRGQEARAELRGLREEYDRVGLPLERTLVRLSLGEAEGAPMLAGLMPDLCRLRGQPEEEQRWREQTGIFGPIRP